MSSANVNIRIDVDRESFLNAVEASRLMMNDNWIEIATREHPCLSCPETIETGQEIIRDGDLGVAHASCIERQKEE